MTQGPRVAAAAAHATALGDRDGDGLLAASSSYEAFDQLPLPYGTALRLRDDGIGPPC